MKRESFRTLVATNARPGITLSPRAVSFLDSRALSLFLLQRADWVEDALRVVIRQLVSADGAPAEYLRLKYSDALPDADRVTEINDERRTLRFRLRYLLRCLTVISDRWEDFQQWHFTGLEGTLWIFAETMEKIVGRDKCAALKKVIARFSRLWKPLESNVASERDAKRELQFLTDEFDGVLESLVDALREVEAVAADARADAVVDAAERFEEASAKLASATELHRRSVVACEHLAAVRAPVLEDDDPYSHLAGLEHLRGAKRQQVLACIRYSHEKMPVLRPTPDQSKQNASGPTLNHLASVVWREHATEYAALAKLKVLPGYRSAASLGSRLYKLATAHPEADHFAWKSG